MADYNKANRQVCDVDIRILSTKKPFLKFETANTTTAGISSDSVYAKAKGSRRIPFANPLEGTMSIEAQVYPFKLFALFADGTIQNDAVYADSQTITATSNGSLTISVTGGYVQAGSVFVYPVGEFGNDDEIITGTFANDVFTATATASISAGTQYEVGYIVERTSGVKRVSFNNSDLQQDYYITMKTADKDENGNWTPFLMTAYKACPKRNFDLSFSSDGDPATVKLEFDLMEDANGNIFDMVEIGESAPTFSISASAIRLVKGTTSQAISITGSEDITSLSIDITDSSQQEYTKVKAILSANNDTLIISADEDAAVGSYAVKLTVGFVGSSRMKTINVDVVSA